MTDVQLKYTKDGVFRKFAFVGYSNEDDASQAIQYFNNTCIDTSRIAVEVCAALGSEQKPQSWSKYAADSSTYKKLHGIDKKEAEEAEAAKAAKAESAKKNKQQRLDDILGEHKNDPKFLEFMKVHSKGADAWDNDLGLAEQSGELPTTQPTKKAQKQVPSAGERDEAGAGEQGDDDDDDEEEEADDDDDDDIKLADQDISDTDYLKSLMNKEPKPAATKAPKDDKHVDNLYTVKIREIPFTTKRKDILKFFRPVKAFSVRLPTRKHGFCYVGFKTEKEFQKAMLKNRSFLNGKQVILIDFTEKNKEAAQKKNDGADPTAATSAPNKNPKWAKQEDSIKNEEDISESGRIFFRNLSYTVTEEQLQALFEAYGPTTDISLPIDAVTRRIKGFGTVTFVMPEHALRAFTELDGSTFQGRLLHLIPGKSRDDEQDDGGADDATSYKKKKELEQKKTAGSAHNWNTLFIGANAVASALAKSYNTSKEQVLDTAAGGSSAAVRLALGETELILDMRKFLEANDVVLDAFSGVAAKRSKRVILAKNLPADTVVAELQPMFGKFGLLGRIVLPPSGVTAIVEFLDSSEAKKAFSKLAYTKFKNLPLYLEWAPENTFKTESTKPMADVAAHTEQTKEPSASKPNPFSKEAKQKAALDKQPVEEEFEQFVVNDSADVDGHEKSEDSGVVEEEDDVDDTEPEAGTTLFLRNLKFSTQVETIRGHFAHIGKIHHAQVAAKKDPDNPRNKISLGYGFIQFKVKAAAEKALKTMQTTHIDGNAVELKRSDRTLQ